MILVFYVSAGKILGSREHSTLTFAVRKHMCRLQPRRHTVEAYRNTVSDIIKILLLMAGYLTWALKYIYAF